MINETISDQTNKIQLFVNTNLHASVCKCALGLKQILMKRHVPSKFQLYFKRNSKAWFPNIKFV